MVVFDYLLNIYTVFWGLVFITDFSFILKKGISNIAGFSVGLAVLLVLRWLLDRKTFARILLMKIKDKISTYSDRKILLAVFLLLALNFTVLSIMRHLSFSTLSWDMGLFDQALWNTTRGDILFSSIRGNMSLLGDHFEPILFLLVPFYAICPRVETLLIIQAVLLAASVFMLYLIARDKLQSRFLIFAIIFSFALSKALRGVNLSDFHPEALMVFFSFAAFYCLARGKKLLLILSIALLLMCKENAALIVFGLGAYAFLALKKRGEGLVLALVALAAWFLETKIILPHFNDFHRYLFIQRLPFGATYQENLAHILRNPSDLLRLIFIPDKVAYFVKLTGPLVFMPLLAFPEYILILASSVTVILAPEAQAGVYQVTSHYAGHLIAFIYIAGIYGAARLIRPSGRSSRIIAVAIIFASILFFGKTDGYKLNKFIDGAKKNRSFQKLKYLSLVPKEVSVSATANLVPHLSHRKYIYDWRPEGGMPETEYYVIDLDFTGYLNQGAQKQIPVFLKKAQAKYREVFSNPEKTFFIFYNPGSDLKKIESYRGNLGLRFEP